MDKPIRIESYNRLTNSWHPIMEYNENEIELAIAVMNRTREQHSVRSSLRVVRFC
jgi:hypothetical protein